MRKQIKMINFILKVNSLPKRFFFGNVSIREGKGLKTKKI